MKLTDLSKTQKYNLCIKLVSSLMEYLNDDEASFVSEALNLCRSWYKDPGLDIAVDLYRYLDDEYQSLSLYEEVEEDIKKNALWNCIIDSVAYICRGAFEAQGAKYFPEAIELVDDDIFNHMQESLFQFNGNSDEWDKLLCMIEK